MVAGGGRGFRSGIDCRTAQAAGEGGGAADEGYRTRFDGEGHEERAVCGNEVDLSVGDDEETGRRWDHAGWTFFKGAVTGGDAIAADVGVDAAGDGGEGGGGAVGVKDVIVLTAPIYDEEITACIGVDEVFAVARKEGERVVRCGKWQSRWRCHRKRRSLRRRRHWH